MKILFLDDSKERQVVFKQRRSEQDNITIVETAQEAIDALKENYFDIVFLDHDLGGVVFQSSEEINCGMEVVRWILENHPLIPKIIVHSWNRPAGWNMTRDLKSAGYDVTYTPFMFGEIW